MCERVAVPLPVSVLAGSLAVAVLGLVSGARLLQRAPVVGDAALTVPWRPVLLLGAAMACFYVADAATSNWSAVYLRDTLGATQQRRHARLRDLPGDLGARPRRRRPGGPAGGDRAHGAAGRGGRAAGLAVVVLAPDPAVAVVGFAVVGAALPVVAPLCFSAAGTLAPHGADAVVARVNVVNYLGAVVGGVSVGLVGAATLRLGFVLPLLLAVVLLGLARAFATGPTRRDQGALHVE